MDMHHKISDMSCVHVLTFGIYRYSKIGLLYHMQKQPNQLSFHLSGLRFLIWRWQVIIKRQDALTYLLLLD